MSHQDDHFKLRPRLVPRPLWGVSAYRLLKRSEWQQIRRAALTAAANTCAMCCVVRYRGMVCDEDWSYVNGIALLREVQVVCPDCNAVIHFGRTNVAGYGQVALEHMARINGVTVEETVPLIDAAFAEWRERSQINWTVAIAPELLERYPELAALHALAGVSPGT